MVLNQHELTIFRGGQFQPFYPGQFRPVFGGQFQPLKVVSLIWSTMVNFTSISTKGICFLQFHKVQLLIFRPFQAF
jgi:hypothetical protein